jgi:hypothetical protein
MLSVEVEREECFALAIIMYYFYLAAFFWMLNIAFNVARFDPPPPHPSKPPQVIFLVHLICEICLYLSVKF